MSRRLLFRLARFLAGPPTVAVLDLDRPTGALASALDGYRDAFRRATKLARSIEHALDRHETARAADIRLGVPAVEAALDRAREKLHEQKRLAVARLCVQRSRTWASRGPRRAAP